MSREITYMRESVPQLNDRYKPSGDRCPQSCEQKDSPAGLDQARYSQRELKPAIGPTAPSWISAMPATSRISKKACPSNRLRMSKIAVAQGHPSKGYRVPKNFETSKRERQRIIRWN